MIGWHFLLYFLFAIMDIVNTWTYLRLHSYGHVTSFIIGKIFAVYDDFWSFLVSFTPLPLNPRGKCHRYPLERRLGVPQSQSGPYQDSNSCPSVVQSLASRYTDDTTATVGEYLLRWKLTPVVSDALALRTVFSFQPVSLCSLRKFCLLSLMSSHSARSLTPNMVKLFI
jgi:hypothetical protein